MKNVLFLISFLITSIAYANPNEDMLKYVEKGYVDDLDVILTSGQVNINYQDQEGNTALHLAVSLKNIEILKLLLTTAPLSAQLYVNLKNNYGDTPFALAVAFCRECVTVLLSSNKEIDLDAGENPPLLLALRNKDDLLAAELIQRGAKSNIPSEDNKSSMLEFLSKRNFPNTLKEYLKLNSDINVKFDGGNTALMIASLYGKLDNVKVLAVAGARLNLRNDKGQTALIASVVLYGWPHIVDRKESSARFNLDVYEYLISLSAKEDFTNNNGLTAANILEINKNFFVNQDLFIETLVNLQKYTPELSKLRIDKREVVGAGFNVERSPNNYNSYNLDTQKPFSYSFNENSLTITVLDQFTFKFKTIEDLKATKQIVTNLQKYSSQLSIF